MAYRLLLAYDGTAFHGFQRQPRQVTVQGELEGALFRLTGRRAPVVGASRTDAGVHATGQVAVWAPADCRIPPDRLRLALNEALNPRIVVRDCTVVADDFDPRRAARAKTYAYRIWTGGPPPPEQASFVWWLGAPLSLPALDRLARQFVGVHDFRAFRGEGSSARTTTRRIYAAGWTHAQGMWTFRVTGNGFLYHMVRMMVGAMVAEVAEGHADLVASGLGHPEGPKVAPPAPAQGLCLERVDY
jgi:tRNA pseudouridine38-40 synthase